MRKVFVLALATLLAIASLNIALAQSFNLRAHLQGQNEVPAVQTLAQGQAILKISGDESAIEYKLIVANIENVTQAHIHCGAAGVNGPVVAFLYGFGPIVSPDGVLAEGTITSVIPRPDSAACPGGVANLEDLLNKLRSGNAYVNVHTTAYPGGEIRGQVH